MKDTDTDGDRNDRARPEPNGHDSFGTGPTVHDGQSVKEWLLCRVGCVVPEDRCGCHHRLGVVNTAVSSSISISSSRSTVVVPVEPQDTATKGGGSTDAGR